MDRLFEIHPTAATSPSGTSPCARASRPRPAGPSRRHPQRRRDPAHPDRPARRRQRGARRRCLPGRDMIARPSNWSARRSRTTRPTARAAAPGSAARGRSRSATRSSCATGGRAHARDIFDPLGANIAGGGGPYTESGPVTIDLQRVRVQPRPMWPAASSSTTTATSASPTAASTTTGRRPTAVKSSPTTPAPSARGCLPGGRVTTWKNEPGTAGNPAATPAGKDWVVWTVTGPTNKPYNDGNHGFLVRDMVAGNAGRAGLP